MKSSQADARYVGHPVAGRRCAGCSMFIAPDRCSAVAGPISPDGHCRFWEFKRVKSFTDVIKEEPAVGDVHVATAIGNSGDRPRRWKPFRAFISGPTVKSFDDVVRLMRGSFGYDPSTRTLIVKRTDALSEPPITGLKNRRLDPYDAGTYHVPFRYSPAALGSLRPDQVPRFLDAVTHPKRLDKRTVPLTGLYAIKDRVSKKTIDKHLGRLGDGGKLKPPTVVRIAGTDHIADGHDRLTARWLNGDDDAAVRYADLDPFSEAKPDPTVNHDGSRYDLLQPANGRRLTWNPNGTLAVPFTYDPAFLSGLRADQVPRFTHALTHQQKLPTATVNLADLRAIQDRVNPDTIASHVADPSKKLPIIVRSNGMSYIADGHDRLTARWLGGADDADVRVQDLGSWPSNAMKHADGWEIPLAVRKADPDQRLIFGWASIVTKAGKPIIDHQNDIIRADELEKAFYDYVLNARGHGHMHSKMGVGRLVECMVFTIEKQDVLKIQVLDDDGDRIEGAWVGYRVDDDDVWAAHKRGELPEFSIGGTAVPVHVEV